MHRLTLALLTALTLMVANWPMPVGAGHAPAASTVAIAPTPTAAACPTPPHGLASPAPDARSAVDGVVRGDDYEGVIFTGAAAEDLAYWFLYFAWTETWEPSAADVAALEAGVEAFLCAEPTAQRPGWDDRRPLWERIAGHKRQYAGVVVEGRRLVLANFFCDAYDDGDDWLRYPVTVLDGGDCFFSLTYDVARGSYDDLMINGEA